MTNGTQRSLAQGIILKIGLPLLIGLITLVAANIGGMQVRNSLELAAVVAFGAALILFIVDAEARFSAVSERMEDGFAKLGKSVEASARAEQSLLGTTQLAEFLGTVDPLLQRLARREIERATSFVRQLPVGTEVAYEGEDRDWLLGLTREAAFSIDAISLSTVDAGVFGLDGGLWTSDLGIRYLELQREAVARKVRIRRIFVFESAEMPDDESFLRIPQAQRDVGIEVRMLDRPLIPHWMKSIIFDFIIFDGAVSFETTPATNFAVDQARPGKLRTRLALTPDRIRDLEEQFELLWEAADPNRKLDGTGDADLGRVGIARRREHIADPVHQLGWQPHRVTRGPSGGLREDSGIAGELAEDGPHRELDRQEPR